LAVILVAKISSWVGVAFLLLSFCAATAVLLVLPFMGLITAKDRTARQTPRPRSSTNLNDAAVGLSLTAWLLYAVFAGSAFGDEMFTLFSNAGFGYVYIMLGMPTFLAAWFGLIFFACLRGVPTAWLFGSLAVAAAITWGYTNIN
jgi:hypothetical protein